MKRIALVAVLAVASPAAADIDIQKADKLFAEGLALRDVNLAQACAKFEESLALNPQAIGTLLNVALCDERLGRIASAHARFSEARDRAKEQQLPDYIAAAEEHITKLAPEIPYLTLTFATPPSPDTKIVVDERVIARDAIARIAVDPGDRTIVVSAPGRLPFTKQVRLTKAQQLTVEVPALAKSVTVNRVVKSSRRSVGRILLGSGGGLALAGVVVGLVARSNYRQPFDEDRCMDDPAGGGPLCTAEGLEEVNSARSLGTIGTVLGVVGLGAAATGAVLWFTAPKSATERQVGLVPQIGRDNIGVSAVGRF